MRYTPQEKTQIRSFFTQHSRIMIPLAVALQDSTNPPHRLSRGDFNAMLAGYVAPPTPLALVPYGPIFTLAQLNDPSNLPVLDAYFQTFLRMVPLPVIPPPPPPPPPAVLPTGGILCGTAATSASISALGLSMENARRASNPSGTDGHLATPFTPGVTLYHKTVDSANDEGSVDPNTGKKKITFFYEQVQGHLYFVAAGHHINVHNYKVDFVVAGGTPGNFSKGATLHF